ncbi:RNA-binding protein [Desulfobacter postgatei]|jgi:RNA recognition motif-containing protein|uniref:RRM domain-containing RNA-binding protein n=1 Tax=Desulfobacter postgatei 2ac9 TaxID=879212 RepID=I5AYM3_9BACT|nr:RNA-binding protein [Desulfobacter postgatei]EIM62336.1 RRM domain-containing RNA-binding protein [Desulfobacter postgatei 2ac9]MDD4273003.1 RNA-binding protein [Desulfobacter postgatei]MDX9962966.1 RNA-binding protein [Desulfobacter postgatei]
MKIYVGNLTEYMTEEALKEAFEAFGEVESVKIIKNRFNERSKGFGFVEMPSNSEADKAIKALNGNIVDKKPIKVNHADSGGKKKKKPFRRRSY